MIFRGKNPWQETNSDELRERRVPVRAHREGDDVEAFFMSTDKVVIVLGCYLLVDRVELEAGGLGLNGLERVSDVVFETAFVTD